MPRQNIYVILAKRASPRLVYTSKARDMGTDK